MANCKKCVFYDAENDELKRRHDDILIIGAGDNDRHFCFAFQPIPDGVFETDKECDSFISDND